MSDKSIVSFVKERTSDIIVPLLMIVFGIIAVSKPGEVIGLAGNIIGILLIAGGIVNILSGLGKNQNFGLVIGIILLVFGILFVVDPFGKAMLIIKIFGFIILLNSILKILEANRLKANLKGSWARYAVYDIIGAVAGGILLFLPAEASGLFIKILGIVLIVSGVINLISAYKVYKYGKYVNDGNVVWEE